MTSLTVMGRKNPTGQHALPRDTRGLRACVLDVLQQRLDRGAAARLIGPSPTLLAEAGARISFGVLSEIVHRGIDNRDPCTFNDGVSGAQDPRRPCVVTLECHRSPGGRRIHRLLAFGEIARADGREQDVVLESAQQILSWQHFHPWGGQLEGERHGIEPPTNRGQHGAVRRGQAKVRSDVSYPFDEKSYGGDARQIDRRHRL